MSVTLTNNEALQYTAATIFCSVVVAGVAGHYLGFDMNQTLALTGLITLIGLNQLTSVFDKHKNPPAVAKAVTVLTGAVDIGVVGAGFLAVVVGALSLVYIFAGKDRGVHSSGH